MATETSKITVVTSGGGVVKSGANEAALIAPIDTGATISANVVKKYRRLSDAELDHGVGSKIANGVKAALGSGLPSVFAVAMAAKTTSSPVTVSVASGTIDTADLPITEVVSAINTATSLTLVYTHEDPTTMSPAPGVTEFAINTKTGKWKTGATVASNSLVITYKSHKTTDAFAQLELESFEYETLAGMPYNAQNYGLFDALLAHATSNKKAVAAALSSGALPADVVDMITTVRNGRLALYAAFYTGDGNASFMAHRARSQVHSTSKEQVAPTGLTYSDSYLRSQYGDEESPTSGTFHHMGVNAVYRDTGGTYRISNDRASTGLTDFYRFHSTMRSQLEVERILENELTAMRRGTDQDLTFTDSGIALVRQTLQSTVQTLVTRGILESGIVMVPNLADISAGDRANRVLPGAEISVVLTGQIHMVKLDLKVKI